MAAIYQSARPTTFDEVVGQDHVKEVLAASVRSGRVGHAYLFSGPRGVGKTTCARLLAMALSCEAEAPEARPCGACEPCRAIRADRHPDVTELDAASNNSVEDVRELRERIGLAATRGDHRVWILDEAHMLSKAAANALLKTLEEPPAGLVFVLATTEPERLPPTVLSRCQHFRFRRLAEPEIAAKLRRLCDEAETEAEDAALALVARVADGGMRDAESLLERLLGAGEAITTERAEAALGLPPRARLEAIATALAADDLASAWGGADGLYRDGFAPRSLAEALATVLRDALHNEVTSEDGFVLDLPREAQAAALHALDDELERFVRRDDLYGLEAALLKTSNAAHARGPYATAPAEPAAAAEPRDEAPPARPAPAPADAQRADAPPPAVEAAPAPTRAPAPAPEPEPPAPEAPAPEAPAAAPVAPDADTDGGAFSWSALMKRAGVRLKAFLQPAEHEVEGRRLILRFGEREAFHYQQLRNRRSEVEDLLAAVAGPGWELQLEGPEATARKKA